MQSRPYNAFDFINIMNLSKKDDKKISKFKGKGTLGRFSYRAAWSEQRDKKLLALVKDYGVKKWKQVAREMQKIFNDPDVSAKKCRERWCNNANPEVDKSLLTECEGLLLLVYHHKHKNKWVAISQYIPHRNGSKLKNNFSSMIRKVARKIELNESGKELTFFEYTQTMYLIILIHELISINDSHEKVAALAPVHIYIHIKEKRITREQCFDYFRKVTEDFLNRHKTKKPLQKLLILDRISTIERFLNKLVDEIINLVSSNKFTEDALLITMGNLLNDREILSPLKIEPPPKDIPYATHKQPLNQSEIDAPPMVKLQNWNIPLLRPTVQPNPLLNFPFPSSVFQKNLSPQFHLLSAPSNDPFASTYYVPMSSVGLSQQIEIPNKSFVMVQGVLDGRMYIIGGSDFSSFTNRFI